MIGRSTTIRGARALSNATPARVRALAVVVVLVLGCASFGVTPRQAPIVTSDALPQLMAGEGILVVQVDTDVELQEIRTRTWIVARYLAAGRYAWLVRLPAGRHAWRRIVFTPRPVGDDRRSLCGRRRHVQVDPSRDLVGVRDTEFDFEVKPGVINYAGELLVRARRDSCGDVVRSHVRNRNHSAMALRSLMTTHGAIAQALPVHYAGTSGDRFLDHFDRERNRVGKTGEAVAVRSFRSRPGMRASDLERKGASAPTVVGPAGQSAEILFPQSGVDVISVSPSGDWIAALAHHGGRRRLLVRRVGSSAVAVVGTFPSVGRIAWEGPDSLLVERGGAHVDIGLVTLRLERDEIRVETEWLPRYGTFVDARPLNPGEVIWEFRTRSRSSVHRLTLDELRSMRWDRFRIYGDAVSYGERLDVIEGWADRWIVDRSGVPRAAWRRDEQGYTILARARASGPLKAVRSHADDDDRNSVVPVGLSSGGDRLLVLARDGGNFVALQELDPGTGELGEVVFRAPDADVTGLLVDDLSREAIGVGYEKAGEARVYYFDSYQEHFIDKLGRDWDGRSVFVVSSTEDRERFVFYVSDATNPGEHFLRDASGAVVSIAREGDEIDREKLTPVRSERIRSKDGIEIEGFLALPASDHGPVPLVVMPHGGPLGVHDARRYDPVLQYLASWGFAVLQANYRGSSGYGLEFEQKGRKQWAQRIEDDIDAAVEWAMGLPEIDERRICVIGGSYGGFSALVSTIRHPDRYRCAVTINGVTDVPLLADSSDLADSEQAMTFYEEFVGDLETERDRLVEISPVYRASEIRPPVLIIQGLEDRRVDPDHAYRLMAMLDLYDRPYDSMFVDGAEHSFDREDDIAVVRRMRRFLTQQLQPERFLLSDPVAPR